MASDLPNELMASISVLDDDLQAKFVEALEPVAAEIGPRELAVLDRLAQGIKTGAPSSELNAFVRLLPVSVSRVLQPAIEPVLAA
jgi:hypothetical protein